VRAARASAAIERAYTQAVGDTLRVGPLDRRRALGFGGLAGCRRGFGRGRRAGRRGVAAGVARAHACARAWAWAGGRQIEILAEQDQ
jgi:hypothetical protein